MPLDRRTDGYIIHLNINAEVLKCAFDNIGICFDVAHTRFSLVFFKKRKWRRGECSFAYKVRGEFYFLLFPDSKNSFNFLLNFFRLNLFFLYFSFLILFWFLFGFFNRLCLLV